MGAKSKTTEAKTTKNASKPRASIAKNAKKKAEKKREPKPPGRKPWLPDYDRIENLARNGLQDKQIAALCNITHEEFCRKKTQLPQLKETLERGRAIGVAACAQKTLQMALSGDRDLLKFFLERVGGWKNVTVIETPPKDVKDMTTEELLAIINGETV